MAEIIGALLPSLFLGAYLFFMIRGFRYQKETWNSINMLTNRINHLYTIIEILKEGLCSPVHKLIASKILQTSPDEIPKDSAENFELFKKTILDNYEKVLQSLKECEEKGPPEEKDKFNDNISEIENIINLLHTVDKNSSNDHRVRIMDEVSTCMMKIARRANGPENQ